jgi:hypothetical protein
MSDLISNPLALNSGLDLSTAKLMVEPGSMLDCLNYEVVTELGYRRIDGFAPYDGNITIADIPHTRIYTGHIYDYLGATTSFYNTPYEDADGNIIGFMFSYEANGFDNNVIIKFMPFDGNNHPDGFIPAESQSWTGDQIELDTYDGANPPGVTQEEFQNFQDYLRGLVTNLPSTPVGLHWFRDILYAVVPLGVLPYAGSDDNQAVTVTIGATVTQAGSGATGTVRGWIVNTAAGVSNPEEGYLLISDTVGGFSSAGTLTGAVTVGAGTVETNGTYVTGRSSDYCTLWKAIRPSNFNEDPTLTTPGWAQVADTYSATVTLSGVTTEFNAVRRGDTVADSTYWVGDGTGVVEVVLLDYFVLDGAFDTGTAEVVLQFAAPTLESGTHALSVSTADDFFSDAAVTTKLGDITAGMSLNYLPGIPSLASNSSRYEFVSANFYASEGMDGVYGVNGAGRAFTFSRSNESVTFIYTQADASRDKPRHVENHVMHLALGFKEGVVQLSVTGSPTNFSGLLGATEIGVGDRVTGLMSLTGATLGVFCEASVWSIVGTSVDAFDTQVILPKVGCIEYTLANCGEPVFCNNNGINTLSSSANYGDFLGNNMSKKVSSWLLPRLRRGAPNAINAGGVACAIPVREKNQYRVFFNDGNILTMTIREEAGPAFTFQKYYMSVVSGAAKSYAEVIETTYDASTAIIPLAWTSQVDWQGKERIFVSHYNEDSSVFTPKVFALETGDSFDGLYIRHFFDINWYMPAGASIYHTLRRCRAHGMSRGLTSLSIHAAGPQTDYFFSGNAWSTDTVPLNLPRTNPIGIVDDLQPVTNITDIVARGLSVQVRLRGSNTDYELIEPTHVVQVLILFTTPDGAPDL